MKRRWTALAILLLVVWLAGCGPGGPAAGAVTAAPATDATTETSGAGDSPLATAAVGSGSAVATAAAGAAASPLPPAAEGAEGSSLPTATDALSGTAAAPAGPTAAPAPAPATRTLPGVAQEIDGYLDSLVETNSFTGAVLVARGGQVLLSKGYGFADFDQGLPNAPDTRFRICSLTKQFTAMGILILQERDKLNVATRICDLMPECPAAWGAITVHHLLVHTSGIRNFTELPDYERTKGIPSTPLQTMARFRDLPLEFNPGDRWSYSNSGYIVLGYLIELASGKRYDEFIRDEILLPLEMDDSGYDHNLEGVAAGYSGAGGPWAEAGFIDRSIPYAAGGLYSTVEDLLRWDQALYTERLIPRDLLDRMFTPHVGSPIGGFGYGWIVSEKHGRPVIRHGGGGDGFVAVIERYPEERVTLVVLSNRETTEIGRIADAIGVRVFGE